MHVQAHSSVFPISLRPVRVALIYKLRAFPLENDSSRTMLPVQFSSGAGKNDKISQRRLLTNNQLAIKTQVPEGKTKLGNKN